VRGQLPTKKFLAFALPAAVVTSSFLALSLCDRLLISVFRSNAEVGTYALGYSIVEQSMVLGFSILQAAGFPKLLEVFERDGYEVGATELARYMTIAMTAVGAIALPIAIFGPELLRLVGGEEFAVHARGFMPLVVVGVLLLGVGQYLSVPLQHSRDSRTWARSLLISVVVNIGLNVLLIPPFGLVGAGVATAVGYLTFLLLSAIEAGRVGVRPLSQLRPKSCLLGAVAGGAVGAVSLYLDVWPIGVVAVPLTYIAVVYACRADIDWSVA
jgi:O-antigen/teichoic acid export membrane protein